MTAHEFATIHDTVPVRESPLRWLLGLDGAVSALNGLAYLLAAGAIGDLLDLPTSLLVPAGAFLVLYGAALLLLSTRERLNPAVVKTVVAMNAIWVVDSVLVAFAGWFDPSGVGIAWILLQAGVVVAFVVGQLAGLRRAQS